MHLPKIQRVNLRVISPILKYKYIFEYPILTPLLEE